MNDRDVIKAELERLKRDRKFWLKLRQFPYAAIITGKVMNMLIDFINHMPEEPSSEDLEKEIAKYFTGWYNDDEYINACKPDYTCVSVEECKDIAHHFADWQLQNMKEPLRMEYEKGRYDMREEMMKEAVDGIVEWSLDSEGCYLQAGSLRLKYEKSPYGNPREGDKVKLIIVKEE